jgi:PleD family two-component response regulator
LCPQTHTTETLALAKRLQEPIRTNAFEHADALTCSFGIAEYQASEDFVAFFDRADSALYQAKPSGCYQIIVAD